MLEQACTVARRSAWSAWIVFIVALACTEPFTPTRPVDAMHPPIDVGLRAAVPAPVLPWTKTFLPLLPLWTTGRAEGVSDNGVVVGTMFGPSPLGQPFYWTSLSGSQALPTAGGYGEAMAISDDGRYVAGYLRINGTNEPVRWTIDDAIVTLDILPRCVYIGGVAYGVNSAGVVAGSVAVAGNKAVTWPTPSSCPAPLVVAGDTLQIARSINDIGSRLGDADVAGPDGPDYLLMKCFFPGGCHAPIQPLPGDDIIYSWDVNDANVVVGFSKPASSVPYKGTAVTWTLATGTVAIGPAWIGKIAISDKGRIVWTDTSVTGRTKLGTKVHSLALQPKGVNACGDIVGEETVLPVLYKKYGVCD